MTLGTLGWPLILVTGGGWFFWIAWAAIRAGTASIGMTRIDRAIAPFVFWLVMCGLALMGTSCLLIAALSAYLSV